MEKVCEGEGINGAAGIVIGEEFAKVAEWLKSDDGDPPEKKPIPGGPSMKEKVI